MRIRQPGRTGIEATLSALTDLVRFGKFRAIGSSSLPASEIVEAPWAGERRSPHRLRTGQPTYSILNQAIERELLPVARRSGMAVSVRSPLAMGLLTGRYRKNDTLIGNIRMHWVPGRPPRRHIGHHRTPHPRRSAGSRRNRARRRRPGPCRRNRPAGHRRRSARRLPPAPLPRRHRPAASTQLRACGSLRP
ncbi:aldo/keto reductase [Streptomyces sp. NPDC059218]|uniref:aldo/keto reductase n=1 Tax=unclassified Streptomyces TaxID=2593676 RepID=UPI00367CAE2B